MLDRPDRLFARESHKWWTLAAVALGLFMIMLDNTVVNVALPSIRRDLVLGGSATARSAARMWATSQSTPL